jgi:hypothetical protein
MTGDQISYGDAAAAQPLRHHERPVRGATDEVVDAAACTEGVGSVRSGSMRATESAWPTAGVHYTRLDDGLAQPWFGCVWLNPPYGRAVGTWLKRLRDHGNGLALVFARTETEWFQSHGWAANALLFLAGRLRFHRSSGEIGPSSAGAPSVLLAYGADSVARLGSSRIGGVLVEHHAPTRP